MDHGTCSAATIGRLQDESCVFGSPLTRSPVNINDITSDSASMQMSIDGLESSESKDDGLRSTAETRERFFAGKASGATKEQSNLRENPDKLVDSAIRSTVQIMKLESLKAVDGKTLDVWKVWVDKCGSVDKLSESDQKKMMNLETKIQKIQDQIRQTSEIFKSQCREYTDGFVSRIQNLERENCLLRDDLRKNNAVFEEYAARLEAIEVKQRDQLQSMVDQSELAARHAFDKVTTRLVQLEAVADRMHATQEPKRDDYQPLKVELSKQGGLSNQVNILENCFTRFEAKFEKYEAFAMSEMETVRGEVLDKQDILAQDMARKFQEITSVSAEMTGKLDCLESSSVALGSSMDQLREDFAREISDSTKIQEGKAKEFEKSFQDAQVAESTKVNKEQLERENRLRSRLASIEEYVSKVTQSNVEAQVDLLQNRLQALENSTTESKMAMALIEHNIVELTKSSAGKFLNVEAQVASLKNQLQTLENSTTESKTAVASIKQKSAEVTQSNSTAVSNIEAQIGSLKNRLQVLECSTADSQMGVVDSSGPSKSHTCTPRPDERAQSSWEVDEGRETASSAASALTDVQAGMQAVTQKLSLLENYVQSHEHRLNDFTLEPYIKSIVHHIGTMHPAHPDHVVRSIENLRSNSQQLTNQLASVQETIGQLRTALQKKNVLAMGDSEMLSQLSAMKQDVENLKSGLGGLGAQVEDQVQQIGKRVTSVTNNADAARVALEDLGNRISKSSRMNEGSLTPARAVPQKVSEINAESIKSFTERLDGLIEKVDKHVRETDKKIKEETATRAQLRKDLVRVLELMKVEYNSDITELQKSVDLLEQEACNTLERIGLIEKAVREVQEQGSKTKPRSGRGVYTETKGITESVRNGGSCSSRGSVRPLNGQHSGYGSSVLRSAKRKRGQSKSISDAEDEENPV